jgi:hypothetical protein
MRNLLCLTPLIMLAACGVGAVTTGPAETRTFAVGAFDAVSLQGSDDVKVVTGATASVVASGPRDILDRLEIRVEGTTLKIGRKTENWSSGYSENAEVRITVTTPGIKAAALSGSGDMSVDRASGDAFNGSVSGSGDLDLRDIRVGHADLNLAGSGDVRVAGATKYVALSVAGSGDIDGSQFASDAVDVSASGSGGITMAATTRAKIASSGSGDVLIKGTANCAISKSGSELRPAAHSGAMKRLALFAVLIAQPALARDVSTTVTTFDRIRVEGNFTVYVLTGRGPSARISGSEAAIERTSIAVQGQSLTISLKRSGWGGYPGGDPGPVIIRLTTPHVRTAAVTGPATLKIDAMRGPSLAVALEGGGTLSVDAIETDRLDIGLAGAGVITLRGSAAGARAVVRGTATLDASALKVKDAKIIAEGAGNITIAAIKTADVQANGAGNTTILGTAACTVNNRGNGVVVCRTPAAR